MANSDDPKFFKLPFTFIPSGVRGVTKNEVHAVELGLIGFLFGVFFGTGLVSLQIVSALSTMAVLSIAVVYGGRIGSSASVTMFDEPWYFIVSYVVLFWTGVVI